MKETTRNHPLARRRKELNLSRNDLVKRLDGKVSEETIGRIERGERHPRTDTLELIADALECDVDYLSGNIEYPKRETADIAERVPLSRVAIELLVSIKKERDKHKEFDAIKHDSHLTILIADVVLASIIGKHDIGGNSEYLTSVMREYLDAVTILNSRGGRFVADHSDEYRLAKWKCESVQKEIGDYLGSVICDQLSLYESSKIRLTDNILLGKLTKEGGYKDGE